MLLTRVRFTAVASQRRNTKDDEVRSLYPSDQSRRAISYQCGVMAEWECQNGERGHGLGLALTWGDLKAVLESSDVVHGVIAVVAYKAVNKVS